MLLASLLIGWLMGPMSLAAAPEEQPAEDQHSLYFGVHLPQERALARALVVAKDLIDQRRYAESLPVLVRVLHAPQDAFGADMTGGGNSLSSLKTDALAVIYALPPEGLQAYHLEVGAQARRAFAKATAAGDAELAEVAGRFPRTEPGRTAAWLLSQRQLEHEQYGDAAALLRSLLKDPDLSREDRASLQTQLAVALLGAESHQDLLRLVGTQPAAKSGLEQLLGAKEAALLVGAPWLEVVTHALHESRSVEPQRWRPWLMAGGSAQRNPRIDAATPHLWASWIHQRADVPRWLSSMQPGAYSPVAGAATPLVVGRWLVLRTQTGLMGVDRQTGKLAWKSQLVESPPKSPPARRIRRLRNDVTQLAGILDTSQRDAVGSRTSSDGRLVFAVAAVDAGGSTARDYLWERFSSRRYASLGKAANQIVAVSVESEGKLVWRTEDHQQLQGVYFLDCPLPVDERLYVVGELEQTIYLFELSRETGAPLWRQPLVTVESPVEKEPMRRQVGAATCYANGLVLCSTGAGVVAAVSPVERSLRWVYRFPVEGGVQLGRASPWGRIRSDRWPANSTKQWLRNQMLVAEGRAYVGSPESSRLNCIDLSTGQEVWSTKHASPQLLCMAERQIVLTARADALVGVDAENGQTRWTARFPADDRPSGVGASFAGKYLQPLASGAVMVVDTVTGEDLQRLSVGPEGALGNVAYDGRAVYSQTHAMVARFDLADSLADRSAEWLAAERAATAGDRVTAIAARKAAYRQSPEDNRTASQLREAMIANLDWAAPSPDALALLDELYADRAAPVELRIARLLAASQRNDLPGIETQLVDFCQSGRGDQLLQAGPSLAIRPTQVFAAVAQEYLSDSRRAELRQELLVGAGPIGRSVLQQMLPPDPQHEPKADRQPGAAMGPVVPWTARQVAFARKQRGPRVRSRTGGASREPREFRLPMFPGPDLRPSLQLVGTTNGRLIGFNSLGEETLSVEIPQASPERLLRQLEQSDAAVGVLGRRLFVGSGEDVLAVDLSERRGRALWSAKEAFLEASVRGESLAAARLASALRTASLNESRLVGVSPRAVVVASDELIACLDPESGAVQWARTMLDTGGWITSDDRFVYSSPQVRPAWRVALADGQLDAPAAMPGDVVGLAGPVMALVERKEGHATLTLYDRQTEQVVQSYDFDDGLQCDVAGLLLVAVDNSGSVEVIHLADGDRVLTNQLPLSGKVLSVTAERFGDRLIVGVNHLPPREHRAAGAVPIDTNPIMTGPVMAYDLKSGEALWPSPAMVAHKAILTRQPEHCSVLTLGANVKSRDASGRYDALHLLMLDTATGRTLSRNSDVRNDKANEYRIRFSQGPRPRYTLLLDTQCVTLDLLDHPAPPGPPATAAVEDPPRGDLWKMGSALERLFGGGLQEQDEDEDVREEDDD